jgi:N-methylhydantoinase B/oxoprolinase/acetone carboxylase alpha subunit
VIVGTAGGGGWGDPAARNPAELAADIANGKVSANAAEVAWHGKRPTKEDVS